MSAKCVWEAQSHAHAALFGEQPWVSRAWEGQLSCKALRLQGLLLGVQILPPLTLPEIPPFVFLFLALGKCQTTPGPTGARQVLK